MFTTKKVLDFNPVQLKFLVVQNAACVLAICEQRDPEYPEVKSLFDPVKRKLAEYVNWADHGYTNALQAQVSLLYDYVKMIVDENDPYKRLLIDPGDIALITSALTAYQNWKTALIAAEKDQMGQGFEHFGDATAFNQKDWTDLNDQFAQPQYN